MRFDAVLFDLDGTLVDSAPDLAGAVNELLQLHGRSGLPFEALRPLAGAGARGMIGEAFGIAPGDDAFAGLRDKFLELYQRRLLQSTVVFTGMLGVLDGIERSRRPWGVVTNKATRLAQPLLHGLDLHRRSAVLVTGDTTPHSKPHPAPLLHAAAHLGLDPARCAYIGDDLRDVQAGRAAGMSTVAAAWGYLGRGESVTLWRADHVAQTPDELLNWLELA